MANLINKYDIEMSNEVIKKTVNRLTNQMWKLIPMRENGENWKKQLNTVIIELVGLNEIFEGSTFLQILSKLEGLGSLEEIEFELYRKTVFECINLITTELN